MWVNLFQNGLALQVKLDDLLTATHVWQGHCDDAVKAPGPGQRRVEGLWYVGAGHDNDTLVGLVVGVGVNDHGNVDVHARVLCQIRARLLRQYTCEMRSNTCKEIVLSTYMQDDVKWALNDVKWANCN